MHTLSNQTIAAPYTNRTAQSALLSRFFAWCAGQEQNRFGWLAIVLAGHGCVLTPLTLFATALTGVNIFFFVLALVAMGMALVTNLAAMPTKVTIPVFALSVLIDLAIILSCFAAA
ncbi:hypothetical protein V9K67_13825 [Paraflavisolibacter sp. H34]|uniref:hypothetical protein n=1 Tax=Huijunlia imazamoxiresistens TaxID=3127457 RepID=UPI00301AC42A